MIGFVGGPYDGQDRDIHKNTDELTFEQGAVLYRRRTLEDGREVFLFDKNQQRRVEQERLRAAGADFDARMEQLTHDEPRQQRPQDRKRRGRR